MIHKIKTEVSFIMIITHRLNSQSKGKSDNAVLILVECYLSYARYLSRIVRQVQILPEMGGIRIFYKQEATKINIVLQ